MSCALRRIRFFRGIARTLDLSFELYRNGSAFVHFARMTPEFKVDFERGARIGLDEALFCESKTVDQVSAIVDAVQAKSGPAVCSHVSMNRSIKRCSRATAPNSNSNPFRALPFSAKPHGELLTAPVAIVMGWNLRSAGRSRGCADARLRRPTVSRIIEMSASQACGASSNGSRISDRLTLSSRRQAWTPLVSVVGGRVSRRGDRVANIRRLRRGGRWRDDAARSVGQLWPGITVVNVDNGYGAACVAWRISLARAASQKRGKR